MSNTENIKVAIGIATAGRAHIVAETIEYLMTLDEKPDELLICPASEKDIDQEKLLKSMIDCKIVFGPRGLPAQRNVLMRESISDVMIFLDDDYLPASDFVTQARELFVSNHSIVVATGNVLADGILTQGLTFEEAKKILSQSSPINGGSISNTYNAYGCNMLIRLDVAKRNNVQFDEGLPLYGWLEDLDFSRRLKPYGEIVRSMSLRGVHLGTKKAGRSPGKQLGYSQIANPVYLIRKGSMSWPRAVRLMSKNVIANTVKSFKPEPWVDRAGRLKGNLLAFRELLTGKLDPKRITAL